MKVYVSWTSSFQSLHLSHLGNNWTFLSVFLFGNGTQILAVLLAVVCVSSAQFPAGWNYNPYLYFPYSALQPPAQETAEVAAARASHMAAHAAVARRARSVVDTPEVRAATIEHYRAYNEAALANGVFAFLPARYANMPWAMPQPVQDTPEVAAARRTHLAAHALAAARG